MINSNARAVQLRMTDIFNTFLAKKTKFTSKPRKPIIKSKISHQPYLHMKMPNEVRITISNGPELIGETFSEHAQATRIAYWGGVCKIQANEVGSL